MNVALYRKESIECHVHVFAAALCALSPSANTAPPITVFSYSTAVTVTRAGHLGPDPFHDLIGFVLGDLDELIYQIATLGRD